MINHIQHSVKNTITTYLLFRNVHKTLLIFELGIIKHARNPNAYGTASNKK